MLFSPECSLLADHCPFRNPSSRHTTFTLDESKLHVVSYDAKGYLEMLETQGLGTNTDDGWRLLPLIGPTRDLVHELTDVHHAYSHARPPSDHISHIRNPLNRAHSGSQAQQKFWLALWADMEDETSGDPSPRLEILLVRCSNAGPS